MIYVYAIAEREVPAPARAGLGGAAVERLVEGPLAAFFSHDPPGGTEPSENTLWEHEAAIEDLMHSGAVLPMRFGSTLSEERALRRVLTDRGPELGRSLERVRGRVELGVRALARLALPEPARATTGREYLFAKLDRRRAAAEIADQLHPSFAALSVASTCRLVPSEDVVFAGAYLVEREQMDDFERCAEMLDRERADLELVCTGPWPPYSFTRDDDA